MGAPSDFTKAIRSGALLGSPDLISLDAYLAVNAHPAMEKTPDYRATSSAAINRATSEALV